MAISMLADRQSNNAPLNRNILPVSHGGFRSDFRSVTPCEKRVTPCQMIPMGEIMQSATATATTPKMNQIMSSLPASAEK